MPDSSEWVLRAAPILAEEQAVPLEPWVQVFAARPRHTIGDLEDCVLLDDGFPSGWRCAVLPEYILPHTLVSVLFASSGDYAMLFLAKASAEFHRQERSPKNGLLGWFHVRLREPVIDERSMVANLQAAFGLLQSQGVIASNGHGSGSDA